jgi:hypothetical protein
VPDGSRASRDKCFMNAISVLWGGMLECVIKAVACAR